jgi:hypothetical protein
MSKSSSPEVSALYRRTTTFSEPHSFYETCCGLCGAQIHFREPLTAWVKVYCPGCHEYVAVR